MPLRATELGMLILSPHAESLDLLVAHGCLGSDVFEVASGPEF